MYFETDRLAHEDKMEVFMPTETFKCSKCGKMVRFTAKADEEVRVKCSCGHEVIAVIESKQHAA